MFNSHTPQQSCDSILQLVRSFPLNYELRETPFSLFLTIRKYFNNKVKILPNQTISYQDHSLIQSELAAEVNMLKSEVHALKVRNCFLVEANDNLTNKYEEEVVAAEQTSQELNEATAKTSDMKFNFEKMESNLVKLRREKNDLETKHVKTAEELKVLKSTHDELKKENNKVNVALKALKKDSKENDYRQTKIIKTHEDTIEELLAFKVLKTKEEKLIKNKKKKLDKKLKQVNHVEVKPGLDLDFNDNESANLEDSITDTILHSVQTKNSFQQLGDLGDLDDIKDLADLKSQCTEYTTFTLQSDLRLPAPSPPECAGSTPVLPAARSPPASTSSTTSASSSSKLGITCSGDPALKDGFRRELWKCEFCDQTYGMQNTLDQVYHTQGHQK